MYLNENTLQANRADKIKSVNSTGNRCPDTLDGLSLSPMEWMGEGILLFSEPGTILYDEGLLEQPNNSFYRVHQLLYQLRTDKKTTHNNSPTFMNNCMNKAV